MVVQCFDLDHIFFGVIMQESTGVLPLVVLAYLSGDKTKPGRKRLNTFGPLLL